MASITAKQPRRKMILGPLSKRPLRLTLFKVIICLAILSLPLYSNYIFGYLPQESDYSNQSPKLSATWPLRRDTSRWCYLDNGVEKGLVYVKVPKAASSTLAGVNMRIARKVGERVLQKTNGLFLFFWKKQSNHICSHTFKHGREFLLREQKRAQFPQRRQLDWLLWSFVREPASRGISAFYHFQVSRKKQWPTLGHLMNYLKEESSNFQFFYLAKHKTPQDLVALDNQKHEYIVSRIQNYILKEYHFLGIVERWTESLAVMILLWDLNIEDVIVMSSKLSGGYDDGRYKDGCIKIQQRQRGEEEDERFLTKYLNSTFRDENKYDYILYEMANKRLTATIEALGADRVGEVQRKIEVLQNEVEGKCLDAAIFPCSKDGVWQYKQSNKDCYWSDSGCGYPCVDRTLSKSDNIQN